MKTSEFEAESLMALTLWDFGDEGWYSGLRGRGTRGWRRRGGVAGWVGWIMAMAPGDVF